MDAKTNFLFESENPQLASSLEGLDQAQRGGRVKMERNPSLGYQQPPPPHPHPNSSFHNEADAYQIGPSYARTSKQSRTATEKGKLAEPPLLALHSTSLPSSRNLNKHLQRDSSDSLSVSESASSMSRPMPQHKTRSAHKAARPRHAVEALRSRRKASRRSAYRDAYASGTESLRSKTSEIHEIKSSLKGHFDAIRSLQEALALGRRSGGGVDAIPLSAASAQTAGNIRDRIKMIEATLREVGETVSASDVASAPNAVPEKPSLQPVPPSASLVATNELFGLTQRLDKMESAMGSIALSLKEIKAKQESKELVGESTTVATNEQLGKLLSEVHKLRFDVKNQAKLNTELLEKNAELERRIESLATTTRSVASDTASLDSRIQECCKKVVQKDIRSLEAALAEKVDTVVLEELARHIATKQDLKKYAKKATVNKVLADNAGIFAQPPAPVSSAAESEAVGVLKEQMEKLKLKVSKLSLECKKWESRLPAVAAEKQSELFIQGQLFDVESKMEKKLQDWMAEKIQIQVEEGQMLYEERLDQARQEIQIGVKALISDTIRKSIEESPSHLTHVEAESNPLIRKLIRDFDEKLYTVCSDVSACKQLFLNQSTQPFYRCAQWLWNSGGLKLGSAVPWNLETANTGRLRSITLDPDNFKWEQDHFNIRIAEAGLYEISLAFFTKAKPSIQIVVNGESVMSAINSPSYVIQHSSGFVMDGNGKVEPGTVTGISLVDFMALPSKSTLSIHYHGVKKNNPAHGFLGLKRL
ncbi:hypothetical protein HDV03_004691 [Kappamyces sp. JEL0829]|nr:hypothetical protein HDV03_004691 [Kappamyces sp. JEL0829]